MLSRFPGFSHASSDNESSFDRLVRLASENSPICAESVGPYLDIASITSESYAKTLDDTFIPILSPSKASCTELVFEMSSISRIDSYSPCSFLVTPNILQVKQEGAQIGFTTQAPASVLKPIFSYTYPDLIKSSVFEENDVATSTNSFCEYIASAILSEITENKTSKVILALNNERIGSFSAIPATPSVSFSDFLKESSKFVCSIFFKNYISLEKIALHYSKLLDEIQTVEFDESTLLEKRKEIELINNIDGLEEIVAASIFIGENDIHSENYGVIFSEGRLQAVKIDHGESLRISHTPVLFNNLSIEFCTQQRGLKLGVHNIIQQNKLDGLIPFSARKFMESIRNILMKINPHNFDAKINYNTCHLSPDLISTIENSISTFLTSHPDMSIMKIAKIPSIENINKKETQYIILSKKRSDYLAALKGISNSILQKKVTESLFTIDFFIKLNIQLGMSEKIIELLHSIKSDLDSLQNKSLSMESRSIIQQESSLLLDSYQKEIDIFINDDSLALKPHSLDATDYFNKLLSQNTGSLLRMYRFLDLIFNKLNYKEDLYLDDIKSILKGKECGLLKFVLSNLEGKLFFNQSLTPVSLIDLFLQKPELILEIKKLSVKFDFFDQDFLEKLITKNYFSRLIISLFDFLVSQEKMAPAICAEKEFYKLQRFFRIQNPSLMSLIFLVLSNHYADYPSSDMDENLSFNYFVKIFNNQADDHFRIIDDIEPNSLELNLFSTLILKSNDNQQNNIILQKINALFKDGSFNHKLDLIVELILNDPIKLEIYSKKEDRSLPLLQSPHGFESQYLTIYLNILSSCPISSLSLMNELLGHILDGNIESLLDEYILSDITDSFYLSLVYWALKIDFHSFISDYVLSEDFKILKAIIIGLTLIEETKTPQEIYEILKTKCPHLIYQNNISEVIDLTFNIESLSPEHQLIINQVCLELIKRPECDVNNEDDAVDFNFNSQEKSIIDENDSKAGTAKAYFAAFAIEGNHEEILRASAKDKKLLLSIPSASTDPCMNQSSEIDF